MDYSMPKKNFRNYLVIDEDTNKITGTVRIR